MKNENKMVAFCPAPKGWRLLATYIGKGNRVHLRELTIVGFSADKTDHCMYLTVWNDSSGATSQMIDWQIWLYDQQWCCHLWKPGDGPFEKFKAEVLAEQEEQAALMEKEDAEKRVQNRIAALQMLVEGKTVEEVAKTLNKDVKLVQKWHDMGCFISGEPVSL